MKQIPEKTIERMSRYRRVLGNLIEKGEINIYSHQLAFLINSTSSQVRRDLMQIGQSGSPKRGYGINKLKNAIDNLLDEPGGQKIALAGIGNLGRAIMTYFMGRRPHLSITAAFDVDSSKINRVVAGCRCYHIDQIEEVILREGITIGIITVPLSAAQEIADRYVRSGIKAIVNWAPTVLQVPDGVFLETRDITMSLEKASYFSKLNK